jgi:hypothetical protein
MDVGVLALQLDQIVRREIDHQHDAARAHDARRLAQGGGGIVGIVQDVVDGDVTSKLSASKGSGHTCRPAGCRHCRCRRARLARQRQHLARLVDADRLFDLGRQHFEQTAGAGADVEQPTGADRKMMGERPFDLAVGDMQRAQFVPALGVVAEKARGGSLAPLLQGVEPRTVGGDAGMLGIEPAHELAHQGGIVARRDQAKARELGFPEAFQEPRFDQEFQMA